MKALGTTKWCSLFILTTGVALIQLPRGEVKAVELRGLSWGVFLLGGRFLAELLDSTVVYVGKLLFITTEWSGWKLMEGIQTQNPG